MSPKAKRIGPTLLHYWSLRTFLVVLLVTAILSSCHRQSGPIAEEQTKLSWLGSMYRMYIGQNQGRAPKNIDELRKFVETKTTPEALTRLKIANMSELFVSPRDGKPFAMVSYDKLPAPVGGAPPPVVLYEVQGQNGERAIAFLGGGTKTVDEAEFQKLLPPQSKPAR